jgi:hypothetical protein
MEILVACCERVIPKKVSEKSAIVGNCKICNHLVWITPKVLKRISSKEFVVCLEDSCVRASLRQWETIFYLS